MIIIFEAAMAIYFVAFQDKFHEQFKPKLQQYLKNTYEGPLGLIHDDRPKPSPASIAMDFVMYNVSDFTFEKSKSFCF